MAVSDAPQAPPGRFKRSRGAPKPFRTLPWSSRAVSDATEASLNGIEPWAVSDVPEAPPGRFERSRGAPGSFRTLPRLLRAVSDAPNAPWAVSDAPEEPRAVSDATEASTNGIRHSRGAPGPFRTLQRCF